jgi:hypothetical protein
VRCRRTFEDSEYDDRVRYNPVQNPVRTQVCLPDVVAIYLRHFPSCHWRLRRNHGTLSKSLDPGTCRIRFVLRNEFAYVEKILRGSLSPAHLSHFFFAFAN